MERLASEANTQLGGVDYSFHPLLPSDESTIGQRVLALAQWCESFTTGFAAGYIRPESNLTREAREILHDFGDLACIAETREEVDEQDEEDFMELVEYVRMAAITLYQQLVGMKSPEQDADPDADHPVLH
jgi:uncharacterized protein YgfB (UPF0149 family)